MYVGKKYGLKNNNSSKNHYRLCEELYLNL